MCSVRVALSHEYTSVVNSRKNVPLASDSRASRDHLTSMVQVVRTNKVVSEDSATIPYLNLFGILISSSSSIIYRSSRRSMRLRLAS